MLNGGQETFKISFQRSANQRFIWENFILQF